MKQHIPNFLTLCNLFCGCCAVLLVFNAQPDTALWFTLGCFFFDYLDGMAARLLGVSSPLGKELDSLADVVSFGVVPGAMLYMALSQPALIPGSHTFALQVQALPAFVLSMFAAYRLGKFNLDTRQTSYFLGLTTPATTVFVLGLTLGIYKNIAGLGVLQQQPFVIYGLIVLLSALMVSEIPMFGLKISFKNLQSNVLLLLFVGLFVGLFWLLRELAFSLVIVCYVLLSAIFKKNIIGSR